MATKTFNLLVETPVTIEVNVNGLAEYPDKLADVQKRLMALLDDFRIDVTGKRRTRKAAPTAQLDLPPVGNCTTCGFPIVDGVCGCREDDAPADPCGYLRGRIETLLAADYGSDRARVNAVNKALGVKGTAYDLNAMDAEELTTLLAALGQV